MEWQKNTSRLYAFIPSLGPSPPGMTLHRPSWVRLNHLRTGVGLFRSTMHKWGLVPSAYCRCRAKEQTADHILAYCPLYHLPNGTLGLTALGDDTVDWLQTTELCIWWFNRPKQRRRPRWYPKISYSFENLKRFLVVQNFNKALKIGFIS